MGKGKKKRNKDKGYFYGFREELNRKSESHKEYGLIREYVKLKSMLNTSGTVLEEILNYYPLNEIIDGDTLNDFSIELLDKAIAITKEDYRKTVRGRDIFLAREEIDHKRKSREREIEKIKKERIEKERLEKEEIEKIKKERLEKERIEIEKTKKRAELKNRLSKLENLIHEMQYSKAATELRDIKKIAEQYDLNNIVSWVEKNLNFCETHMIKKTVLELGTKFARLQIAEISEVCVVKDEHLIIIVVKEMILNNEIYAQYFSSTKAVAFNQQANIDEIDKLMGTYEDWENKRVEKK